MIDRRRVEEERDKAYALSYIDSLCEWGYITIDEYKELESRIEKKKPSVNMNGYFGYDTWYKEKYLKEKYRDRKEVKMIAVDLAEEDIKDFKVKRINTWYEGEEEVK